MPDDITRTHLAAALLDQKVAGTFRGKRYAYAVIPHENNEGWWQLAVTVQGELGYNPIDGIRFDTHTEAKQWADGLNAHLKLSPADAALIVASTFGNERRRTH